MTDLAERHLDRLITWISATDMKMVFYAGITTAMLGFLAANYTPGRTASVAFAIGAIPLLVVLAFLFIGSLPRTKPAQASVLFFGSGASMGRTAFLDALQNVRQDSERDEFAVQCHELSMILARRYRFLNRALAILLLSFVPWLGAAMFLVQGGGA